MAKRGDFSPDFSDDFDVIKFPRNPPKREIPVPAQPRKIPVE